MSIYKILSLKKRVRETVTVLRAIGAHGVGVAQLCFCKASGDSTGIIIVMLRSKTDSVERPC